MLTLEFKADFSLEQQAKIDRWLEINRSLWNMGLAALEDFDDFYSYVKGQKEYAPCCPIQYEYRPLSEEEKACIPTHEKTSDRKYLAPFCRIISEKSRWYVKKLPIYKVPTPAEKKDSWGWLPSNHDEDRKYSNCTGYSCPIPRYGSVENPSWYEPMIRNPTYKGSGGLSLVSKTENLPQWMKDSDIPQRFRAGEMGQLDTAWQEYLKSRYGQSEVKRGKPQYKRKRDKLQTLINTNPSANERLVGNNIFAGIPKLGKVRCKGIDKRWRNPDGSIPRVATYKICKRPDAYYIQLSGEVQRSFSVKATNASIGIDPGLQYELSLSDGTRIQPQKFYRKSEERRAKLQQKLAKKLTERLILWIHHPDRTIQEIRKNFFPISNESYEALRAAKTEAEVIKAIGASRLNTLKYNIVPDAPPTMKDKSPFSGAKQKALEKAIRKLDRKISLQRRNHDHKITTMIVRNYGFIAVEDGLQDEKLRKRTKPKEREDGQGYEQTGAKRKSGLSKSLADASPGRKIAFLKQKADRAGRVFSQHPAPYTTKECPVCGSMNEASYNVDDEGNRLYLCIICGWECDRDVNSGVNIELAQFGNNPHTVLSANAQRARFANSVWEIAHPEASTKPRWKKTEKRKKRK
ncbi:type V CRISPR-associated protein C2c8 [Allocoleopsis franciscana]|uniref:Transposase n=1 Tax=Allocoleopsis franciscana PCC 7113 TaxID=1173027 RepID=K9WFH0_9CYAN|nr:type V CRISPR-associated protein C2c8 [Allocoleopsis franciscana]AFZ18968.1 transposase [Allocoleopsis franciscana PCC 7113]